MLRSDGSIPAWAGKPNRRAVSSAATSVHPRVGGETETELEDQRLADGPSPRGRGNPSDVTVYLKSFGSIPAWAGKPQHSSVCDPTRTVHPRVGGETDAVAIEALNGVGPSPRGRGNPHRRASTPSMVRSIPAWAGKPPRDCEACGPSTVHPRVGGETGRGESAGGVRGGPSPRGRGNHLIGGYQASHRRSIPAWAGKPLSAAFASASTAVHPRVGGETDRSTVATALTRGPSPRGRGNP